MEFSLLYDILFKCPIYHYYYLNRGTQAYESMSATEQTQQLDQYNVDEFFDILPTENTIKKLRNNKLIFKKLSYGFCVAAELDANDTTKSIFSLDDLNLTFLLIIKNPYFFNTTALPMSENNNQIYYFNNRNGLHGSVYPSLSLNYPSYTSGNNYEMGSLVTFSGSVYEAIETITSSSIDPDQVSSGWQLITDGQYVNINDRVSVYHQLIAYTLPSAGLSVTLQLTDYNGNIAQTTTDNSSDGILERKLNAQQVPSGRYTLVITNNADSSTLLTKEFYLINEMYRDSIFGIIEISGDTSLGSYSLTDNSRNLNKPEFRLNFKNRSTIWRYINTANRSVVLESGPNPNTSNGFISVLLDGNELPNPSVDVIKPETDKIVSEIFINT